MPDDIVSVRSVQLHELLGSTMTAVIQADGLAAQATLDFVETVGFTGATGDGDGSAGELRMATFRYTKLDANNQPAEFVAEIPVLSLVPVPALQIDEAKFSFAVKIDSVSTTTTPAPQEGVAFAVPTKTTLFARPAYSSGPRNEEVRSTHHLEIEVTMRQADIPVGLEKVFNLMDQAIQDRKAT